MKLKKIHILLFLLALCLGAIPCQSRLRRPIAGTIQMMKGKKTITDRLSQYGDLVQGRLAPAFHRIGVAYPPNKMTLVGLKAERQVQVWVAGSDGIWKHLKDYPILGMSGTLGPKLKEGDYQVPEGLYRVESLNPNSLYHLALRVNYPSPEDKRRATEDGRSQLGSDIMIHGKDCSVGCLAMGDDAAEDLFILAAKIGIDNITIILSPVDFRVRELPKKIPHQPPWTPQLYDSIRKELGNYRVNVVP